METKIVNINKDACLQIVDNQLNLFAQEIIKKNKLITELKIKLDKSRKENVKLCRAYSKEIGVLK